MHDYGHIKIKVEISDRVHYNKTGVYSRYIHYRR